jgi:hypothetical protein
MGPPVQTEFHPYLECVAQSVRTLQGALADTNGRLIDDQMPLVVSTFHHFQKEIVIDRGRRTESSSAKMP